MRLEAKKKGYGLKVRLRLHVRLEATTKAGSYKLQYR